ncbi:MAG: hypothetical protein Q9168_004024 [Polycauliona sp. 1 TL-2023]
MSKQLETHDNTSSSLPNHVHASTADVKFSASEKVFEESGANDANDSRETDVKKKQVPSPASTEVTALIYGDIGTSPLYVYSSTFTSEPSYDDLLGALSLIIWTVTLMVSIKYVIIVLHADDEGEGGTFAIYSLLSRYVRFRSATLSTCGLLTPVQANIVCRDPREERSIKMERVEASSLPKTSKHTRSFIEGNATMKILLKVVGVLGVSLVMSDGILTPAQSVLGAIQGLRIVDDSISTATIVGVSCAILILLFLIQPFGTSRIGSCFAPIVIIWLGFNFFFGIYNLVEHDHSVLKAFSPSFAGQYLVRNKTEGWKSLGGILLAFTGVEALFADLGAFTRRAIQMSWLCFAYPCVLLAYIGQAAYISHHPEAYSNPFFNAVPPGMFYPSLVVAVLAAVVASQTMVTATFQLLSQIIKLSYFPQVKLVHTSKVFHGQIYIPWVNWLLMVGTIVVTVAYNNTTKLGQAYGVCVILVTFITTSMVSLVALIIWRIPLPLVLFGFLVFGALDGVYLSSALTKVPEGAWFTLILAILLSSIFVLWRFGKENQWAAESSDRLAPSEIIDFQHADRLSLQNIPINLRFTPTFGSAPISTIKGIGIFFDKSGLPNTTPTVFIHFLQKFQAAPAVAVFFHIRPLSIPSVAPEDRFTVNRCLGRFGSNVRNQFFRVTLRHGYTDEVVHRDLGMQIYEQLRGFVIREGAAAVGDTRASSSEKVGGMVEPMLSMEPTENMVNGQTVLPAPSDAHQENNNAIQTDTITSLSRPNSSFPQPPLHQQRQILIRHTLHLLSTAYTSQLLFIVGKSQMRIHETPGGKFQPRSWARKIALAAFLWLRSQSGSKVANLDVDVERIGTKSLSKRKATPAKESTSTKRAQVEVEAVVKQEEEDEDVDTTSDADNEKKLM